MRSELDKVKSTITISLGTKTKLKQQKGSRTYEEFINYLLRQHNNSKLQSNKQKTFSVSTVLVKRKTRTYKQEGNNIVYSYNKPFEKKQHFFDLTINSIRTKTGKKLSYKEFSKQLSLQEEYTLYFKLLQEAIREEIESTYTHKARIEDRFAWQQEFETLGLSKTALEEDVMEPLEKYLQRRRLYD